MKNARFSQETLKFIEKASRQKNAAWLDRNREEYERVVQSPLQNLAQTLKTALASDASGYHFPRKGIGRIKRSSRSISQSGFLYKDWISYSASRPATSRFEHNPNVFFLIQPGDPDGDEVLLAGGLYMPSSRQLRAIREAITNDTSAFDRLFASKSFSKSFPGGFCREKISTRAPRGFDPNHPRMDWLKFQAYFVWRSYSKREFASPGFFDQVAGDSRQILRLNHLLESALHRTRVAVHEEDPDATPGLLTRLETIDLHKRFEADFS